MKKEFILTIDTETAPIDNTKKVNGNNALVYDLGVAVSDRNGKIYETLNLVIDDIMFGEYKRMRTSYYADKLPQYYVEMGTGVREIVSFAKAKEMVNALMEKYNIKKVAAYNTMFDYYALKKTNSYLHKEYKFFGDDVEYIDIMKMAKAVFKNNKRFLKFVEKHNLYNDYGNPKISAENVYRYIKKDVNFTEKHTGLKDVEIETEIMGYLNNRKVKLNRGIQFSY